jgi:Amt family ammonium transporter
MNAADTAWIMIATALVLFMTLPGLALFYGGLVRARNVLSVFMHCYAIACLMSILWFAFGYSIAFGGDGPYWGGLDKLLLNGVTIDSLTGTLPEILFFAFQMTFAIITPALIVGAYVERIGFGFVLLFSSLWACGALGLGRRLSGGWRYLWRGRRARFCGRHRGA